MSNVTLKDAETTVPRYAAYKRIEADLRGRVSRGEWGPGALLPRRRDLAKEYKIDVNTLQRAILPLVADGTLRAAGKRGTYVSENPHTLGRTPTPKPALLRRVAATRIFDGASGEQVLANKTVGVIVHMVTGQALGNNTAATHTRDVVRAIEWACTSVGGQTRVFNTYLAGGTGCTVIDAAKALLAEGIDALLVLDIYDTPGINVEVCSIPIPKGFPLIYVSSVGNFVPALHVFYDQRHAGYLAANHLIERGWTDLTFVVPYRANWVEDRLRGARLAVETNKTNRCTFRATYLNPDADQYGPVDLTTSAEIIRQMLLDRRENEGIIAANDNFARMVIEQATALGIVVGSDYAITGFDDDIESSATGLTSVRPPLEDMGNVAIKLLSSRMLGESVNMHVCLRSQIVVRSSSYMVR